MTEPRTVAVVALDGVVPSDLSNPVDTFGFARLQDGRPAYRVRVCGTEPGAEVTAGPFTVQVGYGLDALAEADTVVLCGVDEPPDPLPPGVREAVRGAYDRGARVASICTGAFLLAATGLLDGQRATTHWLGAAELARRYPAITVDPEVLYVDNGRTLTSAGVSAGLDLCLHMIRADFGAAVAADVARMVVSPLERDGGQAQFINHEPPVPGGASLEPLLAWLRENAHRELTLADMADRAALSVRTLNRRFREQTGTTPLRWLQRTRVRRAQYLLESTDRPVERIAADVGCGSPAAFRDSFKRVVGVSPRAYRGAFRSPDRGRYDA
ncbi:GlxA family transcriptional regulator [Streptomyces sp. AA0539]|uniref:GlxA family transcriptional regulator n=1 Tax=Streptomyces sp. AA0539 TaxID=1210045 RepID=UPI0002F2BE77|nr:helix-turn-helix domain-containing protein [Streptomyces sp. AA0539]